MSINPPAGPVPSQAAPPYRATGPGPARAHVRRLRRDGRTYRAIANAAGLDRATVSDLARGRRRPRRGTTTAVLAVTSQAVPRGRVDAGGSRLRLRALHVMGHGSARIARALGVREMTIRQIVRGDARTVSLKLRDAIAEHPRRFERIVTDRRVVRRFGGLSDEAMLTRVPRGYAADHPAARWLRFQSFTLGRALTDAQAVSARLPALLEADFRLIVPLVRWINGALGLKAAERR